MTRPTLLDAAVIIANEALGLYASHDGKWPKGVRRDYQMMLAISAELCRMVVRAKRRTVTASSSRKRTSVGKRT